MAKTDCAVVIAGAAPTGLMPADKRTLARGR